MLQLDSWFTQGFASCCSALALLLLSSILAVVCVCGVREHLAVGQAGVDKFRQLLANLVLGSFSILLFLYVFMSAC